MTSQRHKGAFQAAALASLSLLWFTPASPARAASEGQAQGREVFERWCSSCHARAQPPRKLMNLPGTSALTHKYQGAKPGALEDRTDLSVPIVRFFVRQGVASMPPFRKTEVTDADLAALAAYLASPPAGAAQ